MRPWASLQAVHTPSRGQLTNENQAVVLTSGKQAAVRAEVEGVVVNPLVHPVIRYATAQVPDVEAPRVFAVADRKETAVGAETCVQGGSARAGELCLLHVVRHPANAEVSLPVADRVAVEVGRECRHMGPLREPLPHLAGT